MTSLLSINPPLLAAGEFSQPTVGTSAFQVAELRGSPHRITSAVCQCSDVVGKEWNPHIMNFRAINVPRCVSRNAKTLGLQHLAGFGHGLVHPYVCMYV
jgi:hypothetical protein